MNLCRKDPSKVNPLGGRAHAAEIATSRLAAQVSASETEFNFGAGGSGRASATTPGSQA